MIVWNYCIETLCLVLVLHTVSISSQQAIQDSLGFRQFSFDESGVPKPREVSRNEQSREQQALVVDIPLGYSDTANPQLMLKHPKLMRVVEKELRDDDDDVEGDQHESQQQESESTGLNKVIQQVFFPNNTQGHKKTDLNDESYVHAKHPMNTTKSVTSTIKEHSLNRPERNILQRRLVLNRLRSPLYRSSQSNSYTKSEQSSEEFVHNVLESIDNEGSEQGNPIKNAFLTKTTSYNISKLLDDRKNRSFLLEKIVNYTTNLNILNSEHVPTNYSDTHGSVLKTVLHLDQYDKTDSLKHDEENQSPASSYNEKFKQNDILGGNLKSDISGEYRSIPGTSPEKQSHHAPTEFLHGQYLGLPKTLLDKPLEHIGTRNEEHRPSDFVGGQFIGVGESKDNNLPGAPELKPIPLDFVEGQYVEQPRDLMNKPPETLNLSSEKPVSPVLGTTESDTQTENGFESASDSNEKHPVDIQQSFMPKLKMENKNKVPSQKPVLVENYKMSAKSVNDHEIIKLTDPTENIQSSQISDLPFPTQVPEGSQEEENVDKQCTFTTTESDFSSSESEEHFDSSKTLIGLKEIKGYDSILKKDLATGKLVTELVNDFLSESTTQADRMDEIETVNPILSFQSGRDLDRVVGEASDIQQNKLNSGPIDVEVQDQFSREEESSQELSTTPLIDDVLLYAGKTSVIEPIIEYQTTQNYGTENGNNYYVHTLEMKNSDSGEEETTELCITLPKNKYLTLLNLLTGELYLQKDDQKINLPIKGNLMKNCNSGTKICRLYTELKNINDSSISEEMFEASTDNSITKHLNSKPKNGKRHITEDNSELIKPEKKTDRNTEETIDKFTERIGSRELAHENEFMVPLTVNKWVSNKSASDYNLTEISDHSRDSLNKMQLMPVKSMEFSGPHHNVDEVDVQTINDETKLSSQTNAEKITLHSLDLPSHRFGFTTGNRLARKIHQKRDSKGHTGGACGCNNPLLLSPSPVPDYRHFVGKRLAILTNMVHTVKDWVAQDALRT